METPNVSVIVPYSKPQTVAATLERLTRQTYPLREMEIVVVGAGSGRLAGRWPITALDTGPIYFPGEARNLGAAAAHGETLLFLDDDCEPAPDWVERNLSELAHPGVGAVGAQIAGKSSAFFARCVDFSSFSFYQSGRRAEEPVCSASLAVRRSVFEAVGGFNETLRSGEDMDFCYRLMRAGYTSVYQPAVKVRHNHGRATLRALIRYSYFYGRSEGLTVKRLNQDMTRRNRVLVALRRRRVYACMIAPIALGATLRVMRGNIREYPQVALYAPFIFLAKVAYHIGMWRWLCQGPPTPPAAAQARLAQAPR